MEEQHTADDQSHYEISLTAGQAFVAFVLLLLSLAASFAFGLMLGKGQADERLVVRKENPVVVEASLAPRTGTGEIVDLDVATDDFQKKDEEPQPASEPEVAPPTVIEEDAAPSETPASATATVVAALTEPAAEPEASRVVVPKPEPPKAAAAAKPSTERVPHFAQLLSTADQDRAEALAVKLINRGYTTAYVDRGTSEKGTVFRVRVRFESEAEARASEKKLREFASEVWITSR